MSYLDENQPTVVALVERGWIVDRDPTTGGSAVIKSVIADWTELSWAKRSYYGGKYGFDDNGVLVFKLDRGTIGHLAKTIFLTEPEQQDYAIPSASMPGSDRRLRTMLESGGVVAESCRYDRSALIHQGPDGSRILTNVAGWGVPLSEPDGYVELDHRYMCYWEPSSANWDAGAPWWASPDR